MADQTVELEARQVQEIMAAIIYGSMANAHKNLEQPNITECVRIARMIHMDKEWSKLPETYKTPG